MSEVYAAQIVDGLVKRVIVGTASWATENLGGFWVDTETLVGIDWAWNQAEGFRQPVVDEPVE
jgi:hypothetical protein